MTQTANSCESCGQPVDAGFKFCPNCGQRFEFRQAPGISIRREGDTGLDKSQTHIEAEGAGGIHINKQGDVGSDQSRIEIDASTIIYQADKPFSFPKKQRHQSAVFPRDIGELEKIFEAGTGARFGNTVLNTKEISVSEQVGFNQTVWSTGPAIFGPGCMFDADVVCLNKLQLDNFTVTGSVVARRLLLIRAGRVHGDVLCEAIEPLGDYGLPAGLHVGGALVIRERGVVRLGPGGGTALTHIGALYTAGDVELWGPLSIGQIWAGGTVSIYGPAHCDVVRGETVKLEGRDLEMGLIYSQKGLTVTGVADIGQLAVRGDVNVQGVMRVRFPSLAAHAGELKIKGEVSLNGRACEQQHFFRRDATGVVDAALTDAPAHFATFNLTHRLLDTIHAVAGLTLTLRE